FAKYKPEYVNPEIIAKYLNGTLPEMKLDHPEGVVSLDSPFYIERPPIETICYQEIEQPGALIRIKAPKKMGKTSFLDRILNKVKQKENYFACLNLLEPDQEIFNNLENFLRWFCIRVTQEIKIPNHLAEYWDEDSYSKPNCIAYFENYILDVLDKPLVISIDNFDQLFSYEKIATEFFSLLRIFHEYRNKRKIWKKLRLILVYSTEPYIDFDRNRSPFNVGVLVEMPEFNFNEVQDLAQRHGLKAITEEEIKKLIDFTGGHPYLIRLAFYHLVLKNITLEEVLKDAATESGIYRSHLIEYLENLTTYPELGQAMKQVITANQPVKLEPKEAFKLESLGLVKPKGNAVLPSCKLYVEYFCDRLGVEA
ncbi:MAG: AAA-like domain-containing protein, partial [Planktothrix agardhii KL2]|uniref:AAA-like domain-containing protein n=1 Tax=Planktothrix agardhii TaxID=1160 RepID=UPI001A1E904E